MQRTVIAVVIAASALVSACASGTPSRSAAPALSATPSSAAASAAASAPAQLVADIDIGGGRTLHMVCVGTAPAGTPTVIGESGLTGDLSTWVDVYNLVGAHTRMCGYDRAGLEPSPAAPGASRTTSDQVDDLEALIAGARLQGPFVFVGHSIGPWNIALYASRHPDDVAGAVFVDPRGPHVSAEWLQALPPQATGEPESVAANRDELTNFETDPSQNPEHLLLRESAEQVTSVVDPAQPLFGAKPVVVLSAANSPSNWSDLPEPLRGTFTKIWLDDQRALAAESSAGEFTPIPDSDHDLPWQRPDAVADVILQVLAVAAKAG